MPDPIRLITKRITTMTYQIVDQKAQFIWGTVLSRNPDGTLNVDDGRGGCVLIVPPTNARTGDRVFVNLGDTIGGIGMPGVNNYSGPPPQVNHLPPGQFIDNLGNIYSETGALTGSGGTPTADVDTAFGYSHAASPDYLIWAGASPSYHDTRIGDDALTTGYQGESYSTNNTVLCAGIGPSAGIYCGAEHANVAGGNDPRWVINIRDSAFALLASNAADYIHSWIITHGRTFNLGPYGSADPTPAHDEDYDVHISPDPIDGSFWVNLVGGASWSDPPHDPAPMFNVSAADGSLIKTVSLGVQAITSFQRAHRVLQAL